MTVNRVFHFAASHFLKEYKGKCENLHGHNYKLIISVGGDIKKDGMIIDFTEIKNIVWSEVLTTLDHSHLNDILDNPTAENISLWIFERLEKKINLEKITLYESHDCFVELTK